MVGRFFKDSAIYALAIIAARGLSLFMVPYYVRVLDDKEIGTLDLLLAWGALAAVVTGLEIAIGMARDYAEQKDDESRRAVVSTALWFSVAVYGVFFIVAAVLAPRLAVALLGNAGHAPAVIASAASVAGGGIFLIVAQQLRYLMKPGLFALTSLTNAVVALSATVFFVSWFRLGVTGVFLGTLTGLAVGGMLAWHFTRGLLGFQFSKSRCAHLLRFSLPLVPSSIAVVVNVHLSRLAIDHFLSRDAVGVYGIAARIGSIITLVMAGFSGAMTPLVFARHAEKETPGDLAKIFRIFAIAALAGTAGFVLFAPEALLPAGDSRLRGSTAGDYNSGPGTLLSQMYIFAPGAWIQKAHVVDYGRECERRGSDRDIELGARSARGIAGCCVGHFWQCTGFLHPQHGDQPAFLSGAARLAAARNRGGRHMRPCRLRHDFWRIGAVAGDGYSVCGAWGKRDLDPANAGTGTPDAAQFADPTTMYGTFGLITPGKPVDRPRGAPLADTSEPAGLRRPKQPRMSYRRRRQKSAGKRPDRSRTAVGSGTTSSGPPMLGPVAPSQRTWKVPPPNQPGGIAAGSAVESSIMPVGSKNRSVPLLNE